MAPLVPTLSSVSRLAYQAVHDYVEFFVARGELGQRLRPAELLDAQFVR